jgi:hypothetical protein
MRFSSRSGRNAHLVAFISSLLVTAPVSTRAQTFKVVNMIPHRLGAETLHNAEPDLSAHPTQNGVIVGSAFASGGDWCPPGKRAPIFATVDDGNSWNLACIIPRSAINHWPQDMTLKFSRTGDMLAFGAMDFFRNDDGVSFTQDAFVWGIPNPSVPLLIHYGIFLPGLQNLFFRPLTDQPQVVSAFGGGLAPRPGPTSLVVAADRSEGSFGGAGDGCIDGLAKFLRSPLDPVHCLAVRESLDQIMAVRAAMHADGTTYAIFYRTVVELSEQVDVVVARRDPWRTTFDALTDSPKTTGYSGTASTVLEDCTVRDGKPGYRLARCVNYSVAPSHDPVFGQERRLQSQLSIAIDPLHSKVVYAAWAEQTPGSPSGLTLHFAHSVDRGASWIISGLTLANATNPSLAVADDGAVGLLYQQLGESVGGPRWRTRFSLSSDQLTTWSIVQTLVDVDVLVPPWTTDPYLGEYIHLEAKGLNFYGVFSASNERISGVFPVPTTFARDYDAGGHPIDRFGSPVAFSIDPYFVKVTRP